MKILAVGGGSGGHVIPVVAVFKEILKKHKNVELRFWCDKKFHLQSSKIMSGEFGGSVEVSVISSGKFRRYNHLTFWQHFTVSGLVISNIVDALKNILGIFQSFLKLIFWRPDVIFCKGGFVCVPVGLAAFLLRVPIVIHDSDAHPGLANRIISKFASKIATGAPLEFYNYPKSKTKYVGIPVRDEFKIYSDSERLDFQKDLGYDSPKPLVVVTGGGLGASRLNNAIIDEIQKISKVAEVVLISGVAQYSELKDRTSELNAVNFHLIDFVSDGMWKILAAADIVVARAGATSNLELAALGKPTILVPNARLTGGHQVKNAMVYQKSNAVILVDDDSIESSPEILSKAISDLVSDKILMERLGGEFSKFAKPKAASEVADMILSLVKT